MGFSIPFWVVPLREGTIYCWWFVACIQHSLCAFTRRSLNRWGEPVDVKGRSAKSCKSRDKAVRLDQSPLILWFPIPMYNNPLSATGRGPWPNGEILPPARLRVHLMVEKKPTQNIRSTIATLLLSAAALIQLGILMRGFIPNIMHNIWEERSTSATWRSASLHLGQEYAAYIEFVKSHVPEDALLIIPKASQAWQYGNIGLMQHYLFPRTIADCPMDKLEECILNLKGSNAYILAPTSAFPPRELADQVKRFIPYGDQQEQGIYVPMD